MKKQSIIRSNAASQYSEMDSVDLSRLSHLRKKEVQSTEMNANSILPGQASFVEANRKFLSEKIRYRDSYYTLIDHKDDLTYMNVLSLSRGCRKLLSRRIGTGKLEEPELKVLDGIKVLLFVWLSLWLGILYQLDLQGSGKEQYLNFLQDNKLAFVSIVSSYISIDLFIMLSSFFVVHSLNRISREYNGISFSAFLQIYLGRFFRFLPLYYFVFLSSLTALWWLNAAPLWTTFEQLFTGCSEYWWANLAFVDNFVPAEAGKGFQGCMVWEI